jgi:hypothetical protein
MAGSTGGEQKREEPRLGGRAVYMAKMDLFLHCFH